MSGEEWSADDREALLELGRAFVEIVHDIKNQLGGLKLYVTFLRRKAVAEGRAADELEALDKLDSGLDRAAGELSVLVRCARPVALRGADESDLARIVFGFGQRSGREVVCEAGDYRGRFDALALVEALMLLCSSGTSCPVRLQRCGPHAVIEWRRVDPAEETTTRIRLRRALGERIVQAHGGAVESDGDVIRVRLPLLSEA
ncbi:MAG: hypothetical protein C4334_05230 [Pyrinomonas sp.]|uniref:hypothetical protein n=1 Tax=Pyrinomonas sp. TaxID=2080306 RepID=UPI003326887F